MTYKNIKEVLVDATKYPAAIEAKLPAGAPTLSTTLVDVAGKIPVVPDFPMELPLLPPVPVLPDLPSGGNGGLSRRFVTDVKETTTPPALAKAVVTRPGSEKIIMRFE